jgi:hypothetical protein
MPPKHRHRGEGRNGGRRSVHVWHLGDRHTLIYDLYYLLVLFLPIIITNGEPTLITEGGWALAWLLISAAVYTGGSLGQLSQTLHIVEGKPL